MAGQQKLTIIPQINGGFIITPSGQFLPFVGSVIFDQSGNPSTSGTIFNSGSVMFDLSGFVTGIQMRNSTIFNTQYRNSPNTYSTGQVSQSAKIVTGSGTTFTQDMVGGLITFTDMSANVLIDKVNSDTELVVNVSGFKPLQNYVLNYGGFQMDGSGGMIGAAAGLTALPLPEDPTDAANKRYVDSVTIANAPFSQGLRIGGLYSASGFVSQTGTTVTGTSGAIFDSTMVGGYLFVSGVGMSKIVGYVGPQTLTVDLTRAYGPSQYNVASAVIEGSCSRLSTTVTATAPAFSASSVGGVLVFGDETYATILSVTSATVCVVDTANPNILSTSFKLFSQMTSLVSSATIQRRIVLPDADDQLVGRDTVDTLSNKTFQTMTINDSYTLRGMDFSGTYFQGVKSQVAPARITTSGVNRDIMDVTFESDTINLVHFNLTGQYFVGPTLYNATYTGYLKAKNNAGVLSFDTPYSVLISADPGSLFYVGTNMNNVFTVSDVGGGVMRVNVKFVVGTDVNWALELRTSVMNFA
jgi:hypothetical protein